jgi:ribosomal protein RSM22 (predicted rRNA methylase)
MQLPAELASAIEAEAGNFAWRELARAAAALSERYRRAGENAGSSGRLTAPERAAYLAVRFPATYAAVRTVLAEARRRLPGLAPRSLLDLASGPGTTAWAASEVFPEIEQILCLEEDPAFIAMGRRLAAPRVRWMERDLRAGGQLPPADLVVLSYAAGELGADERFIEQAWAAAAQALIVLEPGTPSGFGRVREIRDWLVRQGANIAAPCPHSDACPVAAPDWCHFAVRVERSSLHRRLKGGELGHEDEKFSYLVAARAGAAIADARIVRHPRIEPGLIRLELCTRAGLSATLVRRSDRDRFRRARKAEWGDEWTG